MSDKPKRGTLKRRLSFTLAVVLSLVIAFVVFTKSGFLPYHVSKYINDHVIADPHFEFSCRKITGNLFRHVVLKNPTLRYHSSEASFNVFRADEVEIDYDVVKVLKFNLVVKNLRLRNVGIQIRRDERGMLILPMPAAKRKPSGETGISPQAEVDNFVIDGLQVNFGGAEQELAVRDVDLRGAFRYQQGVGRLEIDQGKAYLIGTATSLHAISLDVTVDREAVEIGDFTVRLDRSFVMANGRYHDGVLERMQLIFNPIKLEEIHALGLIPDISGEFGGNVILDGSLDSLSIKGSVAGAGLGVALGNFSFDARLAQNQLYFSRIDGDVFGAHMTGEFRYNLTGDNGFWYDGRCAGLDLTQGFLPDRGLPDTDLNGHVTLEYNGGDGRYEFSADLDSARIDQYRSLQTVVAGRWTDSEGLGLDEFRLYRPGYTVEGNGSVDRAGRTDILFTLEGNDLSYFWEYAALPPIHGYLSIAGRISGSADSLQVNLNGEVENASYMFAQIDTGTVQAEVRGIGSDHVSASVDVAGKSLLLRSQTFQRPHMLLETYGSRAVIRDFSFSKGDSFFTTDFEVETSGDSTWIDFRHVSITTPFEEWRSRSPATLSLHKGSVSVDSLVFVSGIGVVGVSGVYSNRYDRCDVNAWGENVDLGLLRDALDLPVRLGGRTNFRVGVGGEVDNPDVSVDFSVNKGVVDSLEFDLLRLECSYADGELRLSDFVVVNAGDSLSARGRADLDKSPVVMLTTGWSKKDIEQTFFRVEIDSRHFPVPSMLKAIHTDPYLAAAFTGRLVLENTTSDPRIYARGQLSPRAGAGASLPPAAINVSYENGSIKLTNVATTGPFGAQVAGAIPILLNLMSGVETSGTGSALNLDVRIESGDLSTLLPYTRGVSRLGGKIAGTVSIRGTTVNPVFSGRLEIKDALVKFTLMDEVYSDINATIDFVDNVIRLTSINGKSRNGQAFFGSGTVTMSGFQPSDYRLNVFLRDFWVAVKPELETRLEGNVTVTGITTDDGRFVPNITGELNIVEATVGYTFESAGGRPATVTLPTTSPGWLCSVDLKADKRVWVRNPDMNIELGGRLILRRDNSGLYFRGDLKILRGSYTLYNNKFRIIDGSLNFSAAEVLRPEIYINAYTPHRIEGGQERRIYLTLTWPHDKNEPTLQLSYDDPGYYETDIWRMLGGTDIAGGLAANTLEKLLNQQMSGLTIDVDRRSTTGTRSAGDLEHELMIGVGKYLWEDVYLRYKQGLTLETEREVEVEYRISNMFLIRSQIIRHSNRRYFGAVRQTADEYNLDVKFRWEY